MTIEPSPPPLPVSVYPYILFPMCPSLASKRPVPHTVSSHTVLYDEPSLLDKFIFAFCSQPSQLREHDLAVSVNSI
jgi:hypothetical protein